MKDFDYFHDDTITFPVILKPPEIFNPMGRSLSIPGNSISTVQRYLQQNNPSKYFNKSNQIICIVHLDE